MLHSKHRAAHVWAGWRWCVASSPLFLQTVLPAAPSGMNCVGISGNQLIHILECEFALPLAGPVYYPLSFKSCTRLLHICGCTVRAAAAEEAAVTYEITGWHLSGAGAFGANSSCVFCNSTAQILGVIWLSLSFRCSNDTIQAQQRNRKWWRTCLTPFAPA